MLSELLSLLTSTLIMGCCTIGAMTVVNKTGNFIKTMEEEKTDAYKKAFDKLMVQSIDEINFSIDSIGLISKYSIRNTKLLFDIVSGNKCIKKDKDGKIIVSDKSKINEEYKEKIEHLYTKLKKYQNEIKKYKKTETTEKSGKNGKSVNVTVTNDDSDDEIEDEDDETSSVSSSDEMEFYLETEK